MKIKLVIPFISSVLLLGCNNKATLPLEVEYKINGLDILANIYDIEYDTISLIDLISVRGNRVSFEDVIKTGNKLFLYISQNCCQECVNEELQRLANISDTLDLKNVVILISYPNPREHLALIMHYNLRIPTYSVYGKSILANKKILDMPLYFTTDFNRKLNRPYYIINTSVSALTNRYLKNSLSFINK